MNATPTAFPATQPARKPSGCAKLILLGVSACVLLLVALAVLGAILGNPVRSESPQSNAPIAQKSDEAASPKTDSLQPDEFQPDDVPANVARLSKAELGVRYKDSRAMPDGEAWTIWIRSKAGSYAEHPEMLHREMIRLACLCHPQGMKVTKFSVIYDDDFTDGLGNASDGKLLQCKMIEGVSEKINWGNRNEDLYSLDFARIFSTDFCHPSYKDRWNATLEK